MIAPNNNSDSPLISEQSISELTRNFFDENGKLKQACATGNMVYEYRQQQCEMAVAVANAIETQQHLAVEAGTGVGKSYAYLVPMILKSSQEIKGTRHPVVVATNTISLQEQLMQKDLPFLKNYIDVDFNAILVKGRSNYICLRRFWRTSQNLGTLVEDTHTIEIQRIKKWIGNTTEGSLQSMEWQPPSYIWSLVCAEQGNCLGKKCGDFEHCFFMKARKAMYEAQVLIVNHHLFFADLSLQLCGASFLPDYTWVVLDEAHRVESVASEYFGVSLSQTTFERWMRRLYSPDDGRKGLLNLLKAAKTAHELTQLWDEVKVFFKKVRMITGLNSGKPQQRLTEGLKIESTLAHRLGNVCSMLVELISSVDDVGIQTELSAIQSRGIAMREELDAFLDQTLDDHAYWVELEGRRQRPVLNSAPIEVGPVLRNILFESKTRVVMTSATLAINNSLAYFRERIGATDCQELCIGSPFDYARQMRIIIQADMPVPTDEVNFPPAVVKMIKKYITRSKGRAFVLFTSVRLMLNVADLAREQLEKMGCKLFVQGTGMSRYGMLKAFQESDNAVLFGVDSFWMGVDVRGDALSNVIITRLPFAVPSHPLTVARMERIKENGDDAFRMYSLPAAALKFKQGVGRLIRTSSDKGIIVILDKRIIEKWYGRTFLSSIPECPVDIEGQVD